MSNYFQNTIERIKRKGSRLLYGPENEQQLETVAFLGKALVIALMLILFTLVLQFNSISKSVIILTEILFSIIGVFLGFSIFGMKISGVMTGLGIVGLAGIVVKNGILVIEFADELSALEAAARLAEADLKYSVRSRSVYVVHKGIVRDTSPDWKPG